MNKLLLVALLVLAVAGPAAADMSLMVRSPSTVLVFLDGDYQGRSPRFMPRLAPGAHELLVEEEGTGEFQIFIVNAPDDERVDQTVDVNFRGDSLVTERVVTQRNFSAEPYMKGRRNHPVSAPRAGTVVPYYPVPVAQGRPAPRVTERVVTYRTTTEPRTEPRAEGRDKTRLRNSLLSVGVLNEIANRDGERRQKIRSGLLGGVLLNEIFNK